MSHQPKYDSTIKEFYAKALGDYIMNYIKLVTPDDLLYYMQLNAVTVLSQIKTILDDESLDDPTCFRRIDAIVSAFHAQGKKWKPSPRPVTVSASFEPMTGTACPSFQQLFHSDI